MTATINSEVRYRRTYVGLWALAAVAFAGLTVAGYAPIGAGAFAVLGAAAIGVHRSYGTRLFDERDETVLRTASTNTIRALGIASAVVFPTMASLHALEVYAWPTWLSPIALFVTALFVVWAGMIALAKFT